MRADAATPSECHLITHCVGICGIGGLTSHKPLGLHHTWLAAAALQRGVATKSQQRPARPTGVLHPKGTNLLRGGCYSRWAIPLGCQCTRPTTPNQFGNLNQGCPRQCSHLPAPMRAGIPSLKEWTRFNRK